MGKIKRSIIDNVNIKEGGTQETQELYKKAVVRYEEKNVGKKKKNGKLKCTKISKDPLFEAVVDEIICEDVKGTFQ